MQSAANIGSGDWDEDWPVCIMVDLQCMASSAEFWQLSRTEHPPNAENGRGKSWERSPWKPGMAFVNIGITVHSGSALCYSHLLLGSRVVKRLSKVPSSGPPSTTA